MRISLRSAVALSLVGGIALSQSIVASASADDVETTITFTGPTDVTVEYGQPWSFALSGDNDFYNYVYGMGFAQVDATGVPSGYNVALNVYPSGGGSEGFISAPYDVRPLAVGTYTFGVSGFSAVPPDTNYTAQTPSAAHLTIEKAKLGIELRIIDAPESHSAVISARFTGRFIDEQSSSFYPGAAVSPAGVWNLTVTDSKGEVALEHTVERDAASDVMAVSFFWQGAEPGEKYTATAAFTPEGPSGANFAVTPAPDFLYTGNEVARTVPTSSADGNPNASLPEAAEFSLPLWSLIVIGVLALALAIVVTVFSLRLAKPPAPISPEASA